MFGSLYRVEVAFFVANHPNVLMLAISARNKIYRRQVSNQAEEKTAGNAKHDKPIVATPRNANTFSTTFSAAHAAGIVGARGL